MNLEDSFHQEMLRIYEKAKKFGYHPKLLSWDGGGTGQSAGGQAFDQWKSTVGWGSCGCGKKIVSTSRLRHLRSGIHGCPCLLARSWQRPVDVLLRRDMLLVGPNHSSLCLGANKHFTLSLKAIHTPMGGTRRI